VGQEAVYARAGTAETAGRVGSPARDVRRQWVEDMPEGDVVWWYAGRLRAALAGRVLTRSDFRVPRYATADLTGREVTEVVSRGKHLLIRVDGGLTVHTHLRMDGSWRIRPASERVLAGSAEPARAVGPARAAGADRRPAGARAFTGHKVRLVLGNDEWVAIGYSLGVVELLTAAQEARATARLGPDLLGPDWDAAEAVRRLSAAPGDAIGEALMDQRNLAGIGNLYKSEVLFLRGIDPWRPVGEIDDLGSVVALAQRLLDANKQRVGQVTTGSRRRGEETWVYGRAGRPCRRCGTPVRRDGQGRAPDERVTFWCPSCQR
jgi:endonuclease VIII